MDKDKVLKGGEFLVKDVDFNEVFIPEQFDEEQLMIKQTCEDFLSTEVYPILDRIDHQEKGLMRSLITKAGELGLLGISVPEEYEGFGQSFVTSMLASDAMGAGYSFSVAYSAHTGIGSLPIVYYGNDEQKQKYLPSLAMGEQAAAYCLTEPNAGSDANSGKSRAVLSDDGKYYILNGQKMWITNGGFADVLTVFAKIDNDRVHSAFIVESAWDGVVINPEEKKMGIKGSSTTQIFFNDVKVPVENLLGGRGKGFRIALSILHMGRIKLGAAVLGAARTAITHSVNYANERKQFGTEISNFAAIKFKIAEQIVRTWVTESAVYRISKNIDDMIKIMIEDGMSKQDATIEGIAHYAIEAAAMKVFGSETLDYVVDEAVQIHGGMGFSAEMPVDRAYRDSRINRIFEGTNEINRLLISETMIKKGPKVGINFEEAKAKVLAELGNGVEKYSGNDYFEEKMTYVRNFKKLAILLISTLLEKNKTGFIDEQETMSFLSDILMGVYASESAVLRARKLEGMKSEAEMKYFKTMVDIYIYNASFSINKLGRDVANILLEGDDRCVYSKYINELTMVKPINTRDSHRFIAEKAIEENKYCF